MNDRSEPPVDYSKDPENRTPLEFEKMVERVVGAVDTLDKHVDKQLDEVRLNAMNASLHVAAAVDRVNNLVMSVEKRVDDKLSGVRWKLVAVLVTCALLVGSEVYTLFWRAKGRDIQYKILETCSECSRR